MKKKNILFVTYDTVKAPIIHSQGIPHLGYYKNKGYQCGIITVESDLSDKEKRYYQDLLKQKNIRWHYYRHLNSPFPPASLLDMLKCFFYIMILILKHQYQIIHCRSYIAQVSGLLAAVLLRKKNIFDMRGLYPDEYVLSGYLSKGRVYRCYKALEYWEIRLADKTVVMSNRFASYIRRLYFKGRYDRFKQKVCMIPNCFDPKKFLSWETKRKEFRKELKLDKKIVITYSGSLAKWQLWQKIIDFYAVIKKKHKNLFLQFLTYEDTGKVERCFKSKKIMPKDYHVLKLQSHEVPQYLSISDIGIMFTTTEISRQVSAPIKFAEFLGSGNTVITHYGVGDLGDVIKKYGTGLLFTIDELHDETVILRKFRDFIKKDFSAMRKKCVKVASKEFDIQIAVSRYLKIYRELLK